MKTVFVSLLLIAVAFNTLEAQKEPSRLQLDMNTGWAFRLGDVPNGQSVSMDDSNWTPATIPHIMQLEQKHCGGDILYDGIGWYRRYFKLPERYKGKRIAVYFQGVMTSCEVYLNEQKIGENYGGYIGFVVDLSDRINWEGNNLLAVRVNARCDSLTPPGKPQANLDFNYYSGIYRDVRMIISDKLFITDALEENQTAGGGQFITFPEVNKEHAVVSVKTHIRNRHSSIRKGELISELIDKSGKTVATQHIGFSLDKDDNQHIVQQIPVINPSLWHPYTPYLYTLRSRIMVDGKETDRNETAIGIRTIRFDTDKGFFINGEHLYMRGCNRHQAYVNVGDAASNSMQECDVIDIKRGGFNAVRAAHYPQDPDFLAACDKHGLLVVECIPGWQFYNPDSVFIKRVFEVGRRMIRRDRNHPSVVLWETALNESRYPVPFAKAIFELSHEEYPGDQMYTAGDYFGHQELTDYYDVFYKQVSKFPKSGNVMSNYPEDQIAVKPLLTREWGDGVGEKPRVSLMENEEEQMKQCRSRFQQLNGDGYFDWCMLDANPRMGGHFVWSYNDYARGCCDESLFCGVADINRYPKFSYYMSQSMRNKNISQEGLFSGPMVYIASYNASPECSSSTTHITVFSNCDAVKLYRNGQLTGVQTREEQAKSYRAIVDKGGSPCFIFDAKTYEKGVLKAEGLINDKVVVTHEVRTPEAPHHIEAVVHEAGIKPIADGSDMIPVYFRICDRNGTLVYDSNAIIDIQVSGEGKLVGEGIRRIGVSPQKVEGGVGFAFIRTTKKAGTIGITAHSKGLQPGQASVSSIVSTATEVPDGQHTAFLGTEDQGYTSKPSNWEQLVLKNPKLNIVKVEAGSTQNGYPVSNITDGDDRTWWIAGNDNLPQTVVAELAEPVEVSAIRILFMKDSSLYKHKVEGSVDKSEWTTLFERECTGWDFKPQSIHKRIKYIRLTFEKVSEGRAGLGEITLFGK